MNRHVALTITALLGAAWLPGTASAQEAGRTLWQGVIHLGDSPAAYPKVTSAGMAFQVPFKSPGFGKTRIAVTAADLQTLSGEGHYLEAVAHVESPQAPARAFVVATARLKGQAQEDREFTLEFDTSKNVEGMRPDYYSVRVRVDTSVGFTLWDDFLVKRIVVAFAD